MRQPWSHHWSDREKLPWEPQSIIQLLYTKVRVVSLVTSNLILMYLKLS